MNVFLAKRVESHAQYNQLRGHFLAAIPQKMADADAKALFKQLSHLILGPMKRNAQGEAVISLCAVLMVSQLKTGCLFKAKHN